MNIRRTRPKVWDDRPDQYGSSQISELFYASIVNLKCFLTADAVGGVAP
jgi:hypothetical protein